VYNCFTKGFLCYLAYCIGRGQWSATIATLAPSVESLFRFGEDGAAAVRFLDWLERHYQHLDAGNNNGWFYFHMNVNDPVDGMRHYNLKTWMSHQRNRLRTGGIHSPSWMVTNQHRLRGAVTHGMLWSNVVVLAMVTRRLNRVLQNERASYVYITANQGNTLSAIRDDHNRRLYH